MLRLVPSSNLGFRWLNHWTQSSERFLVSKPGQRLAELRKSGQAAFIQEKNTLLWIDRQDLRQKFPYFTAQEVEDKLRTTKATLLQLKTMPDDWQAEIAAYKASQRLIPNTIATKPYKVKAIPPYLLRGLPAHLNRNQKGECLIADLDELARDLIGDLGRFYSLDKKVIGPNGSQKIAGQPFTLEYLDGNSAALSFEAYRIQWHGDDKTYILKVRRKALSSTYAEQAHAFAFNFTNRNRIRDVPRMIMCHPKEGWALWEDATQLDVTQRPGSWFIDLLEDQGLQYRDARYDGYTGSYPNRVDGKKGAFWVDIEPDNVVSEEAPFRVGHSLLTRDAYEDILYYTQI